MSFVELDPFDLPEWLGEGPVAWAADMGLGGHLVAGRLTGGVPDRVLPCDLLAADQAYPTPVLEEATRIRVHQTWRHGQVLLLTQDDRPAVAVPGTEWPPELVLEALTRLARSVGADPAAWSAHLALNWRQR